VSDASRTIIDVLDDPSLGGGIRTVADVLSEYMSSDHRDDALLVDYGDRLSRGAVFKRLGYLIELLGLNAPDLLDACQRRRGAGLIALDPSVKVPGRIVRRWGLRANVSLTERDA
jgi:predicted transcriptional regulator of viral defense system